MTKTIKVTCHKCGYSWVYKGVLKIKTTCPNCQYKTPIHPAEKKKEVKPNSSPK